MYRSLLICALVLLIFPTHSIFAQAGLPAPPSSASIPPPSDSLGPIIDTIIIDNREVYDTGEPKYDHFFFRAANRIHIATRENIVRRELLFSEGEPYPYELAEESERNLRARLALYDAWIETETLTNGHLKVTVVTIDEWTLALGPNVRREGNEYRYDFSLVERNLLGRSQEISARYVWQQLEDNFVDLSYANGRLWGRKYRFAGGYRTDPLSGTRWIEVGHPFYNLAQDYAYRLSVGHHDGRRDVYRDDSLIAQSYRSGDRFEGKVEARTGSYHRKLVLTGRYEYRYENTYGATVFSEKPSDLILAGRSFAADSAHHTLELGLAVSNVHFSKMRRIDAFSPTEDFTLGQGVSLSFGRAFRPGFNDFVYDKLATRLAMGYRLGQNLIFGAYERAFWFRGQTDIRQTTSLAGRLYSRPTSFITVAMRASYTSDWRADGSEGLVLGGDTGLRGYDQYFRTGDRVAVANFEARFFPSIRLHSAIFSPVLFADLGQAWKRHHEIHFNDVYAAVGAGLRVALEHTTRERLLRFDFSYSEVNGWQLSVSSHHYFGAPGPEFFLTSY